MESETNTTRKGFFKRAGLGLAGIFASTSLLKGASNKPDSAKAERSASVAAPRSAMSRVRVAKGSVARDLSA